MKFEFVIDSRPTEVKKALLKEGKLVEHTKKNTTMIILWGDIYLGKVKKIVSKPNAHL